MRARKLGIVGGSAPQTGLLLQYRLQKAVSSREDLTHIPLVTEYDPLLPSGYDWLNAGIGRDPVKMLINMAKSLANSGAEAILIPSNTAHCFNESIISSINIPVINMIDAVVMTAQSSLSRSSCVAVISSPAEGVTSMYETALKRAGLSVIFPENSSEMLAAIESVKLDGANSHVVDFVQGEIIALSQKGAKSIVLGCSEMSLIADYIYSSVPILDALDALVSQAMCYALHSFPSRSSINNWSAL